MILARFAWFGVPLSPGEDGKIFHHSITNVLEIYREFVNQTSTNYFHLFFHYFYFTLRSSSLLYIVYGAPTL